MSDANLGQKAAAEDPATRRRRKRRDAVKRLLWHVKLATYHRWLYRPHMQLIHRWGFCRMTHYAPYPPSGEFWKCDWCGMAGQRQRHAPEIERLITGHVKHLFNVKQCAETFRNNPPPVAQKPHSSNPY